MRALIIAALTITALVLLPFVVQAQVNVQDMSNSTVACGPTITCGSIGTSPQITVPRVSGPGGSYARTSLTIANSSAGATISCGYNASITLNGIGTFTLAPGQTAFWQRQSAPQAIIYCIASAGSTPAQIMLGS